MGERVVLFPLPLRSHFNLMLQIGSLLHARGGFSVSVICTRFNHPDPACYPEFTFHLISDGLPDPVDMEDVMQFLLGLNKTCVEPLRECLSSMVAARTTACLITDAFLYSCQVVATSLGLRRFVIDANASFFLTTIAYHRLKQHLAIEDKEKRVPEVLPLKMKDLPLARERSKTASDEVIPAALSATKASNGIIFNSFIEHEACALAKVKEELSVPVFTCGPIQLFNPFPPAPAVDAPDNIIQWLDSQSPNSVIYISLGTLISMDKSEFLELAWGIATTNRPFLWAVRPGLVGGIDKDDALLPKEFMESVEGRGRVVSWAPQQEVLAHPSVGGFWNHGGWNSIQESICAGVPMICLPFFGDQMSNARYVSDVWKIGLYFEEKLERCAVERCINKLMVGNVGQEMREQVTCLMNKAKECAEIGGSSYKSLDELCDYVRNRPRALVDDAIHNG